MIRPMDSRNLLSRRGGAFSTNRNRDESIVSSILGLVLNISLDDNFAIVKENSQTEIKGNIVSEKLLNSFKHLSSVSGTAAIPERGDEFSIRIAKANFDVKYGVNKYHCSVEAEEGKDAKNKFLTVSASVIKDTIKDIQKRVPLS